MTSRKKLVISLTVVALVIVAAVVAVVGVLAANQQTINSGVYITFTAVDIDGSVTSEYLVQDKTLKGFETGKGTDLEDIVFKANDVDVAGISIGSAENPIQITNRDYAVFIQFTFTRSSVDYNVSATFLKADDLYKVEYVNEDGEWAALSGSPEQVISTVSADADAPTVLVVKIEPKDIAYSITKEQVAAAQPSLGFVLNAN